MKPIKGKSTTSTTENTHARICWLHKELQTAGVLAQLWIICSTVVLCYINLKTFEQQSQPKQPIDFCIKFFVLFFFRKDFLMFLS